MELNLLDLPMDRDKRLAVVATLVNAICVLEAGGGREPEECEQRVVDLYVRMLLPVPDKKGYDPVWDTLGNND